MGGSRWHAASVYLALAFALVVGAVSRMEAADDPIRLKALCTPIATNTDISTLTPDQLTNSLPCAEKFDMPAPPTLDGQQIRFQQGFDYLSWMTFLAMNAPANGDPITKRTDPAKDAPAKWESLANFRPLVNVMRSPNRPISKAD